MQTSRETQGRMLCFFDLIKLLAPFPPKNDCRLRERNICHADKMPAASSCEIIICESLVWPRRAYG